MTKTHRRLVADRFRRVWQVVQEIADHPGQSRRELADKFCLSERQLQSDLTIARCDMRLPLVRNQGYRFASEAPSGSGFNLREILLLLAALSRARGDRSIPTDQLDTLIGKLPTLAAPHLAPLAEQTLRAAVLPGSKQEAGIFPALSDALLTGAWVKLHYATGDHSAPYGDPNPLVRPELLLPYLSSWYVMGEVQHGERQINKMLCLDAVAAVTIAAEPVVNGRLA